MADKIRTDADACGSEITMAAPVAAARIRIGDGVQEEGIEDHNTRKGKIPSKASLDLEATFVHPLLIDHIAENVFNYLQHEMDLWRCFDVCRVWRKLVTPFYTKRASPVQLSGNLTDEVSKLFLSDLVNYPELKMEKFHFSCVNLNLPTTKSMLQQIGENVKFLILDYEMQDGESNERNSKLPAEVITSGDLKNLLLNQLPNLETLEIKNMRINLVSCNMNYPNLGKELKLKEIKFHCDVGEWFVRDLCSVCPHLESIQVSGMEFTESIEILWPLKKVSRINQIKKLKFSELYDGSVTRLLDFLNRHLDVGQLEEFNAAFVGYIHSSLLEEFLNQQGSSLKSLELKFHMESIDTEFKLNPMPNLRRLKIQIPNFGRTDLDKDPKVDLGFHNVKVFKFPKLETLGLIGDTRFLIMDSLFPNPTSEEDNIEPVTSLRVISNLPFGVDQPLMKRIGQLFPNLTVLIAVIPMEFRGLVISIWEYCTNLEELVLTLFNKVEEEEKEDCEGSTHWFNIGIESERREPEKMAIDCQENDCRNSSKLDAEMEVNQPLDTGAGQPGEEQYRSLDSIFSGISESQCQNLKELTEEELEKIDWISFRTDPSLYNLKKLRKLHLISQEKEFYLSSGKRGGGKFTNVFGYSTLRLLPPTVTYAYIHGRLADLSQKCIQCIRWGLNLWQCESRLESTVYFITPRHGYIEEEEMHPFNWFNPSK